MKIYLPKSLTDKNQIETSHTDWSLIFRQICFVDKNIRAKLSNYDEIGFVLKRNGKYEALTPVDLQLPIVGDELHIALKQEGQGIEILLIAAMYAVGAMTATAALWAVAAVVVSALLAPKPPTNKTAAKLDSFGFTNPSQNSEPGAAVPLVYGRALVGSVIISAGITAKNVYVPPVYPEPDDFTPLLPPEEIMSPAG